MCLAESICGWAGVTVNDQEAKSKKYSLQSLVCVLVVTLSEDGLAKLYIVNHH
jgi:hypothetical protein